MTFKYESVVPWGRSYQEYVDMFGLSEVDLNKTILGCGDGPASFNCIMNKSGKRVTSIDTIYQLNKEQIEKRINETFHVVISQTRVNQDKFVWTKIKNVDELGEMRMSAMRDFLDDYDAGKIEKRYLHCELPHLPFADKQFDLSLSSHFLFLYTDNLSFDFHFEAIKEMLRVSKEARIFPLLDFNAVPSPHVSKIIDKFSSMGYCAEEVEVSYEFQKDGNKMLKIS